MPDQIRSNDVTLAYVNTLAREREHPVLARLRDTTGALPMARMQISPEQGRIMAVLVSLLGARRALEIGVFTGYSSISVAQQLPAGGKLVACDVSKEWTSIAQQAWREAGVQDKIELRLGPAAETLAALIDAGESGTYDFAFIDADKENTDLYYERSLSLLRPGGALAVDNAFMSGRAIQPPSDDPGALVMHALVKKAYADQRVEPCLIPVRDGVLLVRKR